MQLRPLRANPILKLRTPIPRHMLLRLSIRLMQRHHIRLRRRHIIIISSSDNHSSHNIKCKELEVNTRSRQLEVATLQVPTTAQVVVAAGAGGRVQTWDVGKVLGELHLGAEGLPLVADAVAGVVDP